MTETRKTLSVSQYGELDKCTDLSIVGCNIPIPQGIYYHSNLSNIQKYVLEEALVVDRPILFSNKLQIFLQMAAFTLLILRNLCQCKRSAKLLHGWRTVFNHEY